LFNCIYLLFFACLNFSSWGLLRDISCRIDGCYLEKWCACKQMHHLWGLGHGSAKWEVTCHYAKDVSSGFEPPLSSGCQPFSVCFSWVLLYLSLIPSISFSLAQCLRFRDVSFSCLLLMLLAAHYFEKRMPFISPTLKCPFDWETKTYQ